LSSSSTRRLRIARAALCVATAMAGVVRAEVPSCTWSVYDGARGEPTTLFTDPDATPPFMMRTSGDFLTGSSVLSESGGIDFDGDGRTDPFRVTTRPDGLLQWQHVSGAFPEKWEDMAYAGDSFLTLHFGDFDADGKTDVFATGPYGQLLYSSGGVGSYQNLALVDGATSPPALGRFDGDAKTDVFAAQLDRGS
jgi:FG-GAP-like repeat